VLIQIFDAIFEMSLVATVLAIVLMLLRLIFKRHMPKMLLICLWGSIIIKLIVPLQLPSPIGIYNKIDTKGIIQALIKPNIALNDESIQNNKNKLTPAVVLPAVWVLGAVGMFAFILMLYLKTIKRYKNAIPLNNKKINEFLNSQKKWCSVKIYTIDFLSTPLAVGIIKPKIILPSSLDIYDENTVRYILMHELQHINYFDNLLRLVLMFSLCLHWFNPVAWLCYILLIRDIEAACDERVILKLGESSKFEYARALLNTAYIQTSYKLSFTAGFARDSVKDRVKSVIYYKKPSPVISVLCAMALLLTVTVFATGTVKQINPIEVLTEEYSTPEIIQDVESDEFIQNDNELGKNHGNID